MALKNTGILIKNIKDLIEDARLTASRNINATLIVTNYQIGKAIIEHEQGGETRAGYAQKILLKLSKSLTRSYGKGFSARNLEYMRKFYLLHHIPISQSAIAKSKKASTKKQLPISQSPIAKLGSGIIFPENILKLSWTHHLILLRIENEDERKFYEIEAIRENWSVKELERQYNSSLYERLALSRDKKGVKKLSKKGQIITSPIDTLKSPYILEFLGLKEELRYTESELETAIINKLEHFVLEMGKGFLFEGRQRRITFDHQHFFVDLVFYNRILKCFVLIDLKIGELTHQDIGQMQMYVNYYDRKVRTKQENKTIGIILCKNTNKSVVEYTLPEQNKQIFSREYKLYLPSKEQLKKQLQ